MKKLIFTSMGLTLLTTFFIFTHSCTSKQANAMGTTNPTYTDKKWYTNEYIPDAGFAQNLMFEIHGRYTRPVKKGKLKEARFISDFIPGYPVNWITTYVSVEISATCNGKTMRAVSVNDTLTAAQKNILDMADLSTDIVTNIKYMYMNPVTNYMEDNGIFVSLTVIPEIEAEYAGRTEQMTTYLKENIINKVSENTHPQFQKGVVIFTVNEEGEIVNVKISQSSGDTKTDKLLLEAISKMQKWTPAQNAKGEKVKQEFVFSIGSGGC